MRTYPQNPATQLWPERLAEQAVRRALAALGESATAEQVAAAFDAAQPQRLIDAYDRALVRRAQAAHILKQRGYDLSDPNVMRTL